MLRGVVLSLLLAGALRAETGYDQTGAAHVRGPNGLDAWGAYRWQDLWTPAPRAGVLAHYQLKVVFDRDDLLVGMRPDIVFTEEVTVEGTALGHHLWRSGEWSYELVPIDETLRQQNKWEGVKYGRVTAGRQTITVTIGTDTLTLTGVKYGVKEP
jgi:hypothetical protein